MNRKALPVLTLIFTMLLPPSANAWNATGHQLVARIAWQHMNENARRNVFAILTGAPNDACLLDLQPNTGTPEVRARTLFVRASTWPDIVRPNDRPATATQPAIQDTRECIKFHHRDWHFINFFWKGISGATNADRPRDLTPQELKGIQRPDVNAVILLNLFEPFMACKGPKCGTTKEERAITLAWILHLVGDIHQPLHTSARVTATEPNGDQGGNLCKLADSAKFSLHGFWDGIIDLGSPRQQNESELAYIDRMAGLIMTEHPRSQMINRLRPFDFDAWAREGFQTTKNMIYPQTLVCGPTQTPGDAYQNGAFTFSKQAIALAGYRLAELLNQLFGS